MPRYKISVDVYVQADDLEEAENTINEEFDYVFSADNNLVAYDYWKNSGVEVVE